MHAIKKKGNVFSIVVFAALCFVSIFNIIEMLTFVFV